ncbi:aromatic ring-hydroxylating oxygenase subunit alpha [Acetobacter cerevisiae]|uniref:Aromatic ring-hydroxylating dioxygenase subunit alpha n=1 Tax=Acetobacter cerevisiae TaxID=178900 RepID=A0A149Q4A3_9PROT|nr:aromatic ring-hydroxylating dioxygenase subunit alpha [Acetobacter cerevisiae]KXU92007.1 Rieske (2Fe-2S) protein [Acetobacter cerevisiae]KXV72441.1 Rieske (2Fe-2S) protein [Acetobacter cerevisiae]MCP1245509.1 aromatic ring-hydroxylating dioxygenase subunit alpha [Acetobacter cerevisiae]MCP1255084.1 aromatic ring-hydroxylating dioxygenase subunit alpha [Acetobacter cerevisiae]GBQ08047.1 ring-hydroxylating dioxygenase ferredoxin subunit [Acetobacter cerevisiae DSM 14362]
MQEEAVKEKPAEQVSAPEYDLRQIDCDPNFWYPIAWSHKVRPGKTFPARYAGHPIALIRPENGPVYALEDRCAHRQVPLSKGKVEGDCIKCCYHGWAFDRAGQCVTVPYLNKEGVGRPVKSYPCREKSGLIFVFPGDPALADSVPMPDIAQVENPEFKTRRFHPRLKCHYTFMHENLMDMNHQFLHRRQMGSITARFMGQDKGENFQEARYSFARKGGNQPLAEALIFGKHREIEGQEQPVEEIVSIRTTYPYQTLQIHDKDGDLVMDLWVAYVPLGSDQLGTQTFGLLSVKKPKWGFLLDMAWPVLGIFTHRIFEEDREIVELEQKAWRELGGDHNIEVFPIVKALRALLARKGVPNANAKPIKEG